MELELTDREYYMDPYGPLDPEYYDNMIHDDIDFNVDLNNTAWSDDPAELAWQMYLASEYENEQENNDVE